MITVRDCRKQFARGDVLAFENLSFDVARHEAVTIVGPSGCGKTTLLKCIDALVPLTSGSIRLAGREITEPDPRIAMVFQHFGLFPWKTVQDNVAYGLRMQGVSRAEWRPRVHRYIGLVGLEGFEQAYPYQLSGGMQQRVGLARALAMEPEVLLMDEPFGAVDAQTREILQQELLRIWEEAPRTMVFVTHDIEEALLVGDRVIVMTPRPGRVSRIVDVPFRRPRNINELYADPRLGRLRNEIWDLLREPDEQVPAASSTDGA